MEKVAKFILKFRLLIVVAVLIVTALFAFSITKWFQFKVILGELMPLHHPYVQLTREFVETFGGGNSFIVVIRVKQGNIYNEKTLAKIKRISDDISYYPEQWRSLLYSIAQRKIKMVRGLPGGLDVSALMWPSIPSDKKGMERLKKGIKSNNLVNGVLVSKDDTAAIILGELKDDADVKKFFKFVYQLKKEEEDENTSLHMVGLPILYGWIFNYLPQLTNIVFVTFIISAVILVLIFGLRLQGIIVPLIVASISCIWGLGFFSLIRINFNPLMIVIPVLVGARALSHSVQLTQRYLEEYDQLRDAQKASQATIEGLFLATFSALVTDAAGFLVLILAKIPAIQILSYTCAFWLFSIFILVAILGPILCLYLPNPQGGKNFQDSIFPRTLNIFQRRLAYFQLNKFGSAALIFLMFIVGIACLYYAKKTLIIGDIHPGSAVLWPDSQYNRDCKVVNDKFDNIGVDNLNIIVKGKPDSYAMCLPEVLRNIHSFEEYLRNKFPGLVNGSQSMAPICKKLNMEFHEGNPLWEVIDGTQKGCAMLFYLYKTSADPYDFNKYTDDEYNNGNIIIFLKNHTRETIRKVLKASYQYVEDHPMENATYYLAGGTIGIAEAVNQEIEYSQKDTLLLIFLVVFVFCAICFRSVTAGIFLGIPLVIANLAAFAFMGYMRIGLDVNTLPVSAIGIGLGVDYGIYLLIRIEEEYKKCGEISRSNLIALTTAGNAVFFTALTLVVPILFWYFLSPLRFQAEMGLLLSILLAFNALGALILIPSMVSIFHPKFLKKQQS